MTVSRKIPTFQYIFIFASFYRRKSTSSGHKDSTLVRQSKHSIFLTGEPNLKTTLFVRSISIDFFSSVLGLEWVTCICNPFKTSVM